MSSPKISHELTLNRLSRYLKHNQDRSLGLDSNYDTFKVDTYPDAEFSGMYGHKNNDDPECAKGRNGLIIMFYGCPVLCIYTLQTGTALSTMGAYIIALARCCQEIFVMIDITQSLGKLVGLPVGFSYMKVYVH